MILMMTTCMKSNDVSDDDLLVIYWLNVCIIESYVHAP